ncbi:Myblike DNAbinding domain-containing protein [Podila verticillata]|nr:Myblike DNAbinding domain-containing protein [Podila verticillata]
MAWNIFTFHSTTTTRSSQSTSAPTELNKTILSVVRGSPTTTVRTRGSRKGAGKPASMPHTAQIWSQEMDAKILDMRLEGNSWKEIGEATGRDAHACHQRYVKQLDPTRRQDWTPQKLEELNKMVAAGKTWRAISEKFLVIPVKCREKWASINPELVQQAKQRKQTLRRTGQGLATGKQFAPDPGSVLLRKHRWSPHMDAVLIDLRERGLTWRQIGVVFGMTPMTAYMRYTYKLKPQLATGWVPAQQNTANTAFYLMKDRPRPQVAFAASQLSAVDDEPSGTTDLALPVDSSTASQSWISSLNDEFSYHVEPTPESRRVWTPEEDAVIIKRKQEGFSYASIGRELSVDPAACYYRYWTALDPASKKKWTKYHSDRLRFFINHGLSWSTISYALGFHRLICKDKWIEISGHLASAESSKDPSQRHILEVNTVDGSRDDKGSDLTGTSQTRYNSMDDHDEDEDYDSEDGEGEGEDVIDEKMGSDDNEDNDAYEAEDEADEDLLDPEDGEEENVIGDTLATGRSKKNKVSRSHSPERTHSIWDQDAYLKEVQQSWTLDQEHALIQHVLRNGTHNWHEISSSLGGAHPPDECRAYWKYLDMPVVRATPQKSRWEPKREAQFWRLWLEHGSNFEEISNQLRKSIRHDTEDGYRGGSVSKSTDRLAAEDCAEFFKQRTSFLSRELGNDDSEEFQKACVELALKRDTAPTFKWDKEKSVKLQKLVRQRLRTRGVQVNWINWKWVSRHVGSGATAQRCNVHWRMLRKTDMDEQEWTNEDILLLEQGVREVGPVFHHEITEANAGDGIDMSTGGSAGPGLAGFRTIQRFYLPDRSVEKLQRKYFLLSDKASQVTVEEYMAIMDAVETHGEDWDKVAESLRALTEDTTINNSSTAWTKAPCRRVWEASYKNTLQHTPWTEQEDQDLKEAVDQIGNNNWLTIARFFPGKSAWQCRLRWCSVTDAVLKQ